MVIEKEKDRIIQVATVNKGLKELEIEKKERIERRKKTQQLNREVWDQQVALKKRHTLLTDPRRVK